MDVNAIAAKLALRYAPAMLTAPTGEKAIVTSTAEPPESIPNTPFVLVYAAADRPATFHYGGQTRTGQVPFLVEFYLETAGSLATQMVRLQKWAGVLLDAALNGTHLDLSSYVAMTWTESFRIGNLSYGGQDWAAVTLVVLVTTTEGIAPVA